MCRMVKTSFYELTSPQIKNLSLHAHSKINYVYVLMGCAIRFWCSCSSTSKKAVTNENTKMTAKGVAIHVLIKESHHLQKLIIQFFF